MGATSNYPSSLDTTSTLPADISATAALNSPNHAQMHERYNDAIIEIEEKVGIGDTTPTAGAVLIGTGTGASAWDTTPTFVGDVTIPEGDLILGSTAVTSTAAELNILDGCTATAAEINVLDGVTGGTVTASKALVVDSNKDIASLRNVTLTGTLTFDSVGITAVTTSAETFADNDTSLLTAGAVVHQFLQYSVEGGADAGATIYVKADAPYADGAGEGVKGDIWIDT
jgi:hypothetical protein